MVLRNRHQAPALPVPPDDEEDDAAAGAGDDPDDAAGLLAADVDGAAEPASDAVDDPLADAPAFDDASLLADAPLTAGALLPSPEPDFPPLSRKSVTYQPEPFS